MALDVLKAKGAVAFWALLQSDETPGATPFVLEIAGLLQATVTAAEEINPATDPLFLSFCDFTWQ